MTKEKEGFTLAHAKVMVDTVVRCLQDQTEELSVEAYYDDQASAAREAIYAFLETYPVEIHQVDSILAGLVKLLGTNAEERNQVLYEVAVQRNNFDAREGKHSGLSVADVADFLLTLRETVDQFLERLKNTPRFEDGDTSRRFNALPCGCRRSTTQLWEGGDLGRYVDTPIGPLSVRRHKNGHVQDGGIYCNKCDKRLT